MRFALAVLAAALIQVVPYLNLARWTGTAAVFVSLYLLLAALGAGFFAGRRPAIAGALSVVGGVTLYGVLAYLTRGEASVGFDTLLSFEQRLLVEVVPYVLAGALVGAAGGWLRAWALRVAR